MEGISINVRKEDQKVELCIKSGFWEFKEYSITGRTCASLSYWRENGEEGGGG